MTTEPNDDTREAPTRIVVYLDTDGEQQRVALFRKGRRRVLGYVADGPWHHALEPFVTEGIPGATGPIPPTRPEEFMHALLQLNARPSDRVLREMGRSSGRFVVVDDSDWAPTLVVSFDFGTGKREANAAFVLTGQEVTLHNWGNDGLAQKVFEHGADDALNDCMVPRSDPKAFMRALVSPRTGCTYSWYSDMSAWLDR